MNLRITFFWIVISNQVNNLEQPHLSSTTPSVAAPGGNVTLDCVFDTSEQPNLHNLIVNWQYGYTVVHSFYLGKDQLEKQGRTYRGRTHLFVEKLLMGNASLLLTNVRSEDKGEYTCHITNEQDNTNRKITLILAALFDEPLQLLQPTCDGVNITFIFSNGFPQPEVLWHDSSGKTISETGSVVQLDDRGRYIVSSSMYLRLNTTEKITIKMKLDVIDQTFVRSMVVHHLDDCQKICDKTSGSWHRIVLIILVGLLFLIICIIVVVMKQRKSNLETIAMSHVESEALNILLKR